MKNNNSAMQSFARCMSQRVKSINDRAVAFLYFYAVEKDCGATLKQLTLNFHDAGLGRPNITKLRASLVKNPHTNKISKDAWRLKSDKIAELEKKFQLNQCLGDEKKKSITIVSEYVDKKRFNAIKKIRGQFDFSRLTKMLLELDHAYSNGSYISVIFLVRAILDHTPPIFGKNTFAEVANNHSGKSFRESMNNLESSSRKIADAYLHSQIRKKESLPNRTQVNFSNDLDVLLAEIIRIS